MSAVLDGSNIRRAGAAGPAVICLHCSSSHSGQYKPYFDAMSGSYRMIAPDLHGYGRSHPLPVDGQPFYVHDAAIVAALVAAEAPAKVHVVGHSLGAATAFYALRTCADRIASLTMIEPVLFRLLGEAADPLYADGLAIAGLIAGYLRLGRPDQAARGFVDFWSGPGAWTQLNSATQRYVIDTIPRVADDWAGMLGGLPDQATLADCAALTMPVQLICGGATRASAQAITDLLRGAMPQATYHPISGADHMAAVTQPQIFLPLIQQFIAANPPA